VAFDSFALQHAMNPEAIETGFLTMANVVPEPSGRCDLSEQPGVCRRCDDACRCRISRGSRSSTPPESNFIR
jgi:hypothetical protein